MKHTILLVQFSSSPDSKTWFSYNDVGACMDGICQLYEQSLKLAHPNTVDVTYTVQHLFDYIDELHDVCAFVQEGEQYTPQSRQWLHKGVFDHMKGQAQN